MSNGNVSQLQADLQTATNAGLADDIVRKDPGPVTMGLGPGSRRGKEPGSWVLGLGTKEEQGEGRCPMSP